MSTDPLVLGLISNSLVAVAEEMGWVLRRTSFSEAVREAEDLSASVFDVAGNMIGASNYAPGHLGASPIAVAAVVRRYPPESMKPGDAFLLNDPSMNSGHLPDIFSIAPIFVGDQCAGFTVVTAHHVDVGGAAPGSQAVVGIVDVHQEGLRILPVKYFSAGAPVEEVFELIAANVRVPALVIGDLKAQYNANSVGARRVEALITRFGAAKYESAVSELLDRTEQAMRAAIEKVPNGEYEFVDFIDDSGPGTPPIRIQVRVSVRDGNIVVDYTGSSAATRSGLNSYMPFTAAYSYHAIQSLVAPSLPHNSGSMRPIVVHAPVGSFFNPVYPTPSGGRSLASRNIVDAVYGAMAQAIPSRAPSAGCQLCNSTFGGIDDRTDRPFVYYDLTFGSTGARPGRDACDGLVSGFNTSNVPIEVHEASQPIRVERFGYLIDTAGAGQYRGGLSVRRDVRNLAALSRLTNLHDRHESAAWGLFGGEPGALGRVVLNPGEKGEQALHSKAIRDLSRNDIVSFRTCGGGGWGDPLLRDPEAVLLDVAEGYVSVEHARARYGVCIEPTGEPAVQISQTITLRQRMRSMRRQDLEVSARSAPDVDPC
jgi:N-methylhydantoinase B